MKYNIGKNIIEARGNKSLNQQELATLVGTTQQQVSRWENNSHALSVNALIEIAEALETSPANLIQSTDVIDCKGNELDFDTAVALMDDDIREDVHMDLAPCSRQEFYDEYVKRHVEKYIEEFLVN